MLASMKRYRESRKGKITRKRREQSDKYKDTKRRYRESEAGKIARKKFELKQYGITVDDYNRIFAEQNGVCAICGRHQFEFKRSLAVDHNRETGEVRGLLCFNCNIKLGYLEKMEKSGFIVKAIKYLGK